MLFLFKYFEKGRKWEREKSSRKRKKSCIWALFGELQAEHKTPRWGNERTFTNYNNYVKVVLQRWPFLPPPPWNYCNAYSISKDPKNSLEGGVIESSININFVWINMLPRDRASEMVRWLILWINLISAGVWSPRCTYILCVINSHSSRIHRNFRGTLDF